MASLTIVLTDLQAGHATALRETAASWARAGIVGDSIWIDRASWEDLSTAQGILIQRTGASDVRVQSEMARREVTALRVASLVVAPDAGEAVDAPSVAAKDAQAYDDFSAAALAARIDFRFGTVAAAVRGAMLPEGVFSARWHFNHLVVPEDRIDDDQFPEAVIEAERLACHGLAALAVAAAMFTWSEEAPVDEGTGSRGNDPLITCVRPYVRTVDGGWLLDQIADAVLTLNKAGNRWPLPSGLSPEPVGEDSPRDAVSRVVGQFVDVHGLRFEPYSSEGPRPLLRLGLWEGLRLFLRTVWSIVRMAPEWFVRRVRDRVEDKVLDYFQSRTFGMDSEVVLTLRGRDAVTEEAGNLAASRYGTVRDLGMPGTEAIVAEPGVWRDLRTTACGLVDGSELTAGIEPPMVGNTRSLLTSPHDVVPLPGDDGVFRPSAMPTVELASCDVLGARELGQYLQDVIDDRVDDDPEADDAPVDLAAPSPETAASVLGQLRAWRARDGREHSFVWRVGEALATAVGDASRELAAALTVIAGGAPDMDESEAEQARRKKFRRYLLFALVALVAGIAAVIYGSVTGYLGIAAAVALGVVWLVAVAWAAVRRFIRYAIDQARAQYQRARDQHAYDEAFNRAQTAASAITRFSALYWQYTDWSEVLGVVLHRPWGEPPERGGDADLDDLVRPLLFTLGTGDVSPDHFQRRVAAAQAGVVSRGWLASVFDNLVASTMDRYAMVTNAADGDQLDPTYDTSPPGTVVTTHARTGEAIGRPRAQVRAEVGGGVHAADLRADEARRIVEDVLDEPIDELFTTVVVHGEAAATQSGKAPKEFLGQILPDADRGAPVFPMWMFVDAGRHHPVATTDVTLPANVARDAPNAAVQPSVHTYRYGARLVLGADRLDASAPMSVDDLSMVERRALHGGEDPDPVENLDF